MQGETTAPMLVEFAARSWAQLAAEAAPTLVVDPSEAAQGPYPALDSVAAAARPQWMIAALGCFPTSATVWCSSANQFQWPYLHQKSAGSARKAPAHGPRGEQAGRQSRC